MTVWSWKARDRHMAPRGRLRGLDRQGAQIDFDLVHGFRETAYWSEKAPCEVVAWSTSGAFCFGVFDPAGA